MSEQQRRDLARKIKGDSSRQLVLHSAVVESASGSLASIRLSGSSKVVPSVPVYLHVGPLSAGQVVEVLFVGADPRIIGRLT